MCVSDGAEEGVLRVSRRVREGGVFGGGCVRRRSLSHQWLLLRTPAT